MKLISLFSGIGGFELAAEWAGWQNVVSCEINPFGRQVLNHYWPNAYHHDDIKTLTFEKIDYELKQRFGANWNADDIVLTGGFPCQPYSAAGKRLGKEDERHLWPEMLRIIREVQPKWVVGENVLGLVNWSGGLVFEEVQADLESEGYEIQPYVLPAASVNAPHKRDRVWFVAFNTKSSRNTKVGEVCQREDFKPIGICSKNGATQNPNSNGRGGNKWQEEPCEWEQRNACSGDNERLQADNGEIGVIADTHNPRCKDRGKQYRGEQTSNGKGECCTCGHCLWIQQQNAADAQLHGHASTKRRCCNGEDCQWCEEGQNCTKQPSGVCQSEKLGGLSNDTYPTSQRLEGLRGAERGYSKLRSGHDGNGGWETFPTQPPIRSRDDGFSPELVGITVSKHRNESIKAYGNAIVPQVVYQIFKAINEYQTKTT
jgi:DNA (cytosine-5)-methyltransferase 1